MLRFIIHRLLYGILVLVLVAIIVSSIVYSAPVDPARLTFGERLNLKALEAKRSQLGLDKGLTVQLWLYLRDLSPILLTDSDMWSESYRGKTLQIGGDKIIGIKWPYLRESYQSGRLVSEIILDSFPSTLILAGTAISLATILGVFLGIMAALLKDSWIDRSIILFSTLGYSVPSYVTAIILAILFGYYFRGFTGLNIQGSLYELNDFGDRVLVLKNLVLPAIALGIRPISIITQLMRSAILQVSAEKYILTARAKGLSTFRIIRSHMLRNAFNPVLTALTGWFASLMAGAFFVEYVFNFKGLGFVTVNALLNYDIPLLLGALLFSCCIFILINIAVDLLYRLMDPRIALIES